MTTKKMTFRTSKGVAMYPWLNKADFQFDSNGQFKVNLRMPADEAKELMDQVKAAANDAFGTKAKSARMPWKTDSETGEMVLVTKSKYKPKFVDSSGQVISENNVPPIYGGSTLKLAGTIYPYTAGGNNGVSLLLVYRSSNWQKAAAATSRSKMKAMALWLLTTTRSLKVSGVVQFLASTSLA